MHTDKLEIDLQINKDKEGNCYLEAFTCINGLGVNQYCEFTDFLLSSKDNRSYHDKKWHPTHKQVEYSSFYPFTCSCGVAGCASIWEGINSKHRKHSVEWRIPRKAGYGRFLDKTFYSFDKRLYENEIDKCWKFLEDNKDVLVFNECYDEDYPLEDGEPKTITLGEEYKWLFED